MVRIAGALILICGTASWGLMGAARLGRKASDLRILLSALQIMRTEICSRLTPMQEVLKMVSAQTRSGVRTFFDNVTANFSAVGARPFSDVWQKAVDATPELNLDKAETLILKQLGMSLGKYDAQQQKQALDYAISRFETFSSRAEQDKQTKSRLNAFMGVAAGIFAVVILL